MTSALISHARLLELLHYDPSTGVFTWLVDRRGHAKAGDVAGSPNDGYLYIKVEQRRYAAHRLAWFYVHKVWPEDQIDHRDTDSLNNRIDNLRVADNATNNQNKRVACRDSKTGFLGVRPSASGKRFQALIGVDGKTLTLGHYATPEEAHSVYLEAKRRLHPGNTL